MGARQGRPPGAGQKGVGSLSRRRFRAALAGTPLLALAAAPLPRRRPHLAAAAPKREGTRALSRRPPPKNPAGSQRSPDTAYMRRYREAGENFLGVGCSNLGVGCLRILGVGCWALDASGEGVGWCWRTPRGDSEVGAQVPRSALIRAPAGSSRPRKVDGGGTGHLGSGSVWSVCECK